ncbi:hypothetical protein B6D60_05615 [candidate division KSB1 bacterium 4484_87]|nr:MAG: hypothetical protein B6D60_05615 [candidate division KSB1 bacterium 4484_87]
MTSLIGLLHERKATRAISTNPLSDEVIEKLMEAAQLSASCFNKQPWRFLFLTEKEPLERGRQALARGNNWALKAPLLIIGFSMSDLDCKLPDGREYYLFDLGMATQNIMLQATELNLVARPMAGFDPEIIKRGFGISDEFEVYIMIAVGEEGDLSELDEKLQERSQEPRVRNPLRDNFYLSEIS